MKEFVSETDRFKWVYGICSKTIVRSIRLLLFQFYETLIRQKM